MADHSSLGAQGLARNDDQDHSPGLENHVGEAVGDKVSMASDNVNEEVEDEDEDDDDEDDEDEDDQTNEEEESKDAKSDAAFSEVEHISNGSSEEDTSNLFPPTPRSLSPPPLEPHMQPLGLHRPFGRSSYDDYDVITVHGVRDDRNNSWTAKNGESWIDQQLFRYLRIRLLNYSYETDDSARIFTPNGIDTEAQELLDSVARLRVKDPETEQDRPIIWICHDTGGSIVKQALMNAIRLQPALGPDDKDANTHELRNVYRKIPILSSAMIFLGCPHRARSIEDLEDELHMLLSLPGPPLRRRMLQKISNLARQIDDINSHFHETKLLNRVLMLNIFSVPTGTDFTKPQEQGSPLLEHAAAGEASSELDTQALSTASAPFSEYTLTTLHPFRTRGTVRLTEITHSELVWGSEGVSNVGDDWVTRYYGTFNTDVRHTISINPEYLQLQHSLLSLAPPTRATKMRFDSEKIPPLMSWIFEQQEFRAFKRLQVKSLYLHTAGLGRLNIGAISQQLLFAYDNDYGITYPKPDSLYFEFDEHDSRYNNIIAMVSCLMSYLVWRSSNLSCSWTSAYFDAWQSWSLDDVLNIFFNLMDQWHLHKTVLILGSFDQCVETQRHVFLARYLEHQRQCEDPLRLIVSTNGPSDSLSKLFSLSETINLEDCPLALDEYRKHTEGPDTVKEAFGNLLIKRRVLGQFKCELSDLLGKCHDNPYLQCRIIQWLEHYARGAPTTAIACAIEELSPVTHHNLIRVFLGSLGGEKQQWAKLICRWVRYAAEPLSVEMLAQAVAVHTSPENSSLQDINYDEFYLDLQRTLGGIVIRDSGIIKFSDDAFYDLPHIGGEEQDESEQQTSHFQGEMAKTCLYYLLSTEGQYMLSTLSVESHGVDMPAPPLMLPRDSLVGYALRFWAVHYQASNNNQPVNLAMELFQDEGKRKSWAEAFYVVSNPFTRIHRSYMSPLPYMAMLGLENLVSEQMVNQKEDESFKRDCWLAITEASRNEHQATLDSLLEGLEVDEAGLRDSIQWAAYCCGREALNTLTPKAQRIKSFQWPQYILCRAATVDLENLIPPLVASGYDMNEESPSGTERAIHIAAFLGKNHVLELMLGLGGADVTLKNRSGGSALMIAVLNQGPETVQRLLDAKASINDRDGSDGLTLVQRAVGRNRHAVLEMLIEAGADFKSGGIDEHGNIPGRNDVPLVTAAANGYYECTRILLDHGEDPNAFTLQGSALERAVLLGPYVEICRILLEKGADLNLDQPVTNSIAYGDRRVLLMVAVVSDDTELVAMLLRYGAKVNSVDPLRTGTDTPLSYAAMFSTIEMVELLLEWGADVNFVSAAETSWSPLFVARGLRITKVLLKHGANVHWRTHDTLQTPLIASHYSAPDIVRTLLKNGSDINAKDRANRTTLMHAARFDRHEIVRTLLQHKDPKPDLEVEDENGWTALLLACDVFSVEATRLLLEAGANINHKNRSGSDAIGLCYYNASLNDEENAVRVIKLLLEHDAQVDAVGFRGGTILNSMFNDTPVSVTKMLVEAGAAFDTIDNHGYTPLGLAVELGKIETVEYLLTVNGVRVNICHPGYGSILHLAVRQPKSAELVKLLIANGADHTVLHPNTGESVLYSALGSDLTGSIRAQIKVLRYLVGEVHADVNAQGGEHEYPILKLLLSDPDEKLLKYFLRHGARLDVTDKLGRGPAHYVAMCGEPSEKKFAVLAKAGASFRDKDHYGRTPLHIAAANCHPVTVKYLLEEREFGAQGYDVDEPDADGWTPLMWACKRSGFAPTMMRKVALLLIDRYGADIWARSQDGQWSPLKIGLLHGFSEEQMDLLAPLNQEATRRHKDGIEETWDPAFHQVIAGKEHEFRAVCNSCYTRIWGTTWRCSDCTDISGFYLCFKCIRYSSTMHDANHLFCVEDEESEVDEDGGEDSDADDSESKSENEKANSYMDQEHAAVASNGYDEEKDDQGEGKGGDDEE